MTHVLVLKVGPVQGFIVQARRTRDLWYGSRLLSDVSRAMARSLQASGARLIFPHPEQVGDASTGVANKVLALVEGDAARVARGAREAARQHLVDEARRVFQKNDGLLIPGAWELAREQLDTFLELHAAWVPLGEGTDYAAALAGAEAALEARRALHAFRPWTRRPPEGTHKSSLDGGRPSVLRRERHRGGGWRRHRIGAREELDALGLLKRAGGRPGQFVPVPSVGLAAWLDTARRRSEETSAALARFRDACGARGFTGVHRPGLPWVEDFPFDAQLLLPERWQPYFEEFAEDGADPRVTAQAAARFGEGVVRPLVQAVGPEPFPYVACLVADGDGMGTLLQTLASRGGHEAHQRVSRALAAFTSEARRVVEAHRGVLVYAGGDDVLAFVCPPDAPACARALERTFHSALARALEGLDVKPPTLSVGLGIGHVLESLGQLLDLGRRAEAAAKDAGRNALALLVAKHSSRERLWTASWDSGPLARLEEDMRLLSGGRLPLGKVHEVEALARRFAREAPGGDAALEARVLVYELKRILARVEAGRAPRPLSLEEVGLAGLDTSPRDEVHRRLEAWASRVLVADTLERAGRGLLPREETP
ncbi:type III-B CRISPR-associated protein Cas10/Cmr2 [Myxococcus sp. RHSTA-1-4]|uniref:type III-B CRISPR-associated protein Cas10/Cmr2 n=1 Tax=Myxococcus sp. RHSTA-1-4 TaxID=2874601 RepID=UPI001CBC51DC|nr:type III-B CRISPR-associated protein Cas10/Cmr2 [Myxococcus sp. RHSTA-1-4]MBZ4423277.1 type III-B CRISPR-associated protein Cas10/Cmr2 [Myxococcus sp. RHSTA-1-4]